MNDQPTGQLTPPDLGRVIVAGDDGDWVIPDLEEILGARKLAESLVTNG